MRRSIQANARAFRALVAVCTAAALCVVLFMQEQSRNLANERAVYSVNAALWKMSETIFESQRLSADLSAHEKGQLGLEAVQQRFDILWVRLDVLETSVLRGWPPVHEQLSRYRQFLQDEEPAVFGDDPLGPADVAQLQARLDTLVTQSRQLWIDAFSGGMPVLRAVRDQQTRNLYNGLTVLLISLLMVYVLAEVFFASRAQEKERQLYQAAAQASEAKSRFLANVSHEIRTPLNGILGMASELAETPLSEDQAHCLNVIEQSGGVLLSTINDVLDLSKVEAGQFHVEMRPFVLRDVLETAIALYAASAREKMLSLELEVQSNLPRVVIGDGRRLRQVMHNLIANAIKFTETGGVFVQAKPSSDGQGVVLSVRDSGIGIPPEAREKIFQPFVQADDTVTRNYGGTGLGLAISRQLCESMGGTLTLVSRVGVGSTFYCGLPITAASEDAARLVEAAPAHAVPDLGGLRVLVADDNATNRMILERFLKPTGATVLLAANGVEAVEICAVETIDLVLMDIQMPRMDGVAATQVLRTLEAEQGRRPTRIIAVTANALSQQANTYREAGMDDVLAKPVSKRALHAMLGRYLLDKAEAA